MNSLRLLLVEDEAISAALMVKLLRTFGYSDILTASSGEQAVALARESHPDLIIMDIGLPGKIDGIEAAKAIRSEMDAMILFVSGYTDKATRERASAVNPIGFLPKPMSCKELESIVETAAR